MCGLGKKNNTVICLPQNGMLVTITHNVFGLGEGGLVGGSILAECFCPLLPNPCYLLVRFI